MESGTTQSKRARIASKEKCKAVLRLLQGEDVASVAQEIGASADRLARWKARFVEAGEAELAKKKPPAFQSRLWKNRKLVVQWAGVIMALVLTVYFLTRFFESGGASAAP